MFNKKILSYLMNLTEEEHQILTGQSLINKDLYTEKKDFEIDVGVLGFEYYLIRSIEDFKSIILKANK